MAACQFSLENINVSIKSPAAVPDLNRMKKFYQKLESKASDKQAENRFLFVLLFKQAIQVNIAKK